ncbi:hypothetical protein GCM10011491_15740 [Brucella endophytica]|uniref:Uncharacterized protein n=1 Tax=Brucella endophytica TaxID=1963359 RepID=A0A916S836_9HYPH|nr:hypothetical protein [Brucella endophytica]GGA88789.1 hypothetical protein GCM10011491_15740 [Brucella endophytica]
METPPPELQPSSTLGRRLAILVALALILLAALAWMTIYLLDAAGAINIDPLTFTASDLDHFSLLVPRFL